MSVMMTSIASEMREKESWIVVELNPARDLLQSLAAKLYGLAELHPYFIQAKLDFAAFGIGVSLENAIPVTDIENAIELMLAEIQKRHMKLLITIDGVTNCEYVRIFSGSYQIFLRQGYLIFLLMTGLYENIYDLQNEKSLTFLYEEYVYSKIWSGLSGMDRKILAAMAVSRETKVKNIRANMGMKSELFSVYRERLKRKGILDTSQEWWEADDDVTLITRPRRFGKNLNMSMLEKFFSVEYAGRGELFEGLFIWEEKHPGGENKYRKLQGTWPVISISFAKVKETTYINTKKKICQIITNLFNHYDFLLDGDMLNPLAAKPANA